MLSQVYASGNCVLWYLIAASTKYEQELGAHCQVASSKTAWGDFGVSCCSSSIFLFWSLVLIVYMIDILLFAVLLWK